MIQLGLIVEGDGEVKAAPVLLRRICREFGHHYVDIPSPVRIPRHKLVQQEQLARAVATTVKNTSDGTPILVLLDADDDCIAALGAQMTNTARAARSDRAVSVVLANREFEAWFLASIDSLRGRGKVRSDAVWTADPEGPRDAKGKLSALMTSERYSPTVDQAALASQMDLSLARRRSRSFAKLWREVEKLLGPAA